jgi:hypothetical protein
MRRILLCFSLLLLISCSDDSTPTNSNGGNNGGGNGGGNKDAMRVTAAIADTLYYDDPAWITVKGLHGDQKDYRLFIHSSEATIDRIASDTIFFNIPRGASTARPRFMIGDSIALADVWVNVVKNSRVEISGALATPFLSPNEGRVGDLVTLTFLSPPLRLQDISIRINGMPQTIVGSEGNTVFARIAPGTTTGKAEVRIFDRPWVPIGQYIVWGDEIAFLEGLSSGYVFVAAYNLDGMAEVLSFNGTDTLEATLTDLFSVSRTLRHAMIERVGDSIFHRTTRKEQGISENSILALRQDPITKLVSGYLRSTLAVLESDGDSSFYDIDLELTDMSWRPRQLYAYHSDVTGKLKINRYVSLDANAKQGTRLIRYSGGHTNSSFTITFQQ